MSFNGEFTPPTPPRKDNADNKESPERGERSEPYRRRMTASMKANKSIVLSLGEELRNILHNEENSLIKDRKYHLRNYKCCFVGSELVDWLLEKGEVEKREEAVDILQKLLEYSVIHHVCDDHNFKDEKLFYRFRRDDGTYQGPPDPPIVARGQRIYTKLLRERGFVADRKFRLNTYKKCFIGQEFVDWLLVNENMQTRSDAIDFGRALCDAGVIRHVCGDHHFKDDYLFYRFINDETTPTSIKERLGLKKSQKNKKQVQDSNEIEIRPDIYCDIDSQETNGEDEYETMQSVSQVEDPYVIMGRDVFKDEQLDEKSGSESPLPPVQDSSVRSGPTLMGKIQLWSEVLAPGAPYNRKEISVTSDSVGFGFIIRGRGPVYVHTLDENGPATSAGLKTGDLLLSVNGVDVKQKNHKEVAQIILQGETPTVVMAVMSHL